MTTRAYPKFRRTITPEESERMTELYDEGYGLPDIAKVYGVAVQVVRHHLLKWGVEMRPVGIRAPIALRRLETIRAEQAAAREAEMDARRHQICEQCGCTYANDRWTVICGAKRCRQQREYHNRLNDPLRREKDRLTVNARRRRDRAAAKADR